MGHVTKAAHRSPGNQGNLPSSERTEKVAAGAPRGSGRCRPCRVSAGGPDEGCRLPAAASVLLPNRTPTAGGSEAPHRVQGGQSPRASLVPWAAS